jgi:LPXTG-site transpeptidase (sortase) family protein
LFGGIFLVNGLTILLIFHPTLAYWWQMRFSNRQQQLTELIQAESLPGGEPKQNRLVIPAMLLDEKIFTGKDAGELKKGVWLRPASSTPTEGSNTVMAGHRTAYSRSPVFYHLDKLKIGDSLAVFWQGEKHFYTVSVIRDVAPYTNEIEKSTKHEQLTLYTCTPLGTSWRRLVVVARKVAPHE